MKHHPIRFFLESDNIGKLFLKCILLLLIPYAYLWFCGLVFDAWLKWYWMTTFTFFSLIFLWIVALIMIVTAIVRFVGGPKKRYPAEPVSQTAAGPVNAEEPENLADQVADFAEETTAQTLETGETEAAGAEKETADMETDETEKEAESADSAEESGKK